MRTPAILATLALLAAHALPQEGAAGAVGDEELAELVEATLPLVEKHAGKRFTKRPAVRAVASVSLERILCAELERQYESIYPHLPPSRRRFLAGTRAALFATALLGKYGLEDHVVYVAPKRIDAMLRLFGRDPELGKPLLQLALAHELTHALQDQHADIGKQAWSVDSEEAHLVFSACVEGHATFVQHRVAEELGFESADKAWGDMQRLDSQREALGVTIQEVLNRAGRKWTELAYLYGARRIEELASLEGEGEPWNLLASPPVSSRFFFDEKDAGVPASSWAELFADLEAELGAGRWFVDHGPLSEFSLRSDLAGLDPAELDPCLHRLVWAGQLSASRTVLTLSGTVWALRFADEAAAKTALALWRRAAAGEEAGLKKGVGFVLERFTFQEVPGVKQGDAVVHDLHVKIPPLQMQKIRVLWRRRGRDLVRIWDQNLGIEPAALVRIADTLLARMAERR